MERRLCALLQTTLLLILALVEEVVCSVALGST